MRILDGKQLMDMIGVLHKCHSLASWEIPRFSGFKYPRLLRGTHVCYVGSDINVTLQPLECGRNVANHKIATIQEIKVRKNDPKVRKIFQKTSKVGATICQFG